MKEKRGEHQWILSSSTSKHLRSNAVISSTESPKENSAGQYGTAQTVMMCTFINRSRYN